MGLGAFIKRMFGGSGAGAGHKAAPGEAEPFDVWEEIDNVRRRFFIGGWADRKIKTGSTDKLREELEALDRKRQAKEGQGTDRLREELEALERKRREKGE